MKTIKDSKINDFEDHSRLPSLKKGETALFRILGIKDDPVNKGRKIIKSAQNVPANDTIFDPTSKEERTVNMAFIVSVGPQNTPNYGEIWFDQQTMGHIILSGNKMRDRELYTYLTLCNFNSSNKDRDTSRKAIFERVDEGAIAETRNKARSIRKEAMNIAAEMTPAELREFVAGMNKDENQPEEVLRDIVGEVAEKSSEYFMSMNKSEDRKIRAEVKYALQSKLITFVKTSRKFKWVATGDEIVTIPRQTGSNNHLDGFVSFVKNHKNGPKVYEELKGLIEEKRKAA